MTESRFRQIHLDFHTSPDIENIGAEFDPEEFATTLEEARVNSITCFARCHHGYLYYDSKEFPDLIHPHLVRKNLLKEQIEACHRHGIKVPIYITVQWDALISKEHPEWMSRQPDTSTKSQNVFKDGFYGRVCVNTPYRDFLKRLTQEIVEILNPDGLFYDIVQDAPCCCKYCVEDMLKKGYHPEREADRKAYGEWMINDFKHDMTNFIRTMNQTCNIFYNCQAVERHSKDAYTHIEIESLPGGEWGYDHFPFESRYVRNFGLDCVGQTGKFHTAWGDFHSFKNQAALEYECFRMLALNCKCCIGDQLHPSGKLSKEVYQLIGNVYRQVESKEAWCTQAKAVVDIGVFNPREFNEPCDHSFSNALIGAMKMLEQTGHQFDVIDSQSDLSRYKLVILPDTIKVDSQLNQKLKEYMAAGGSVIASFLSGIDEKTNDTTFDLLPVIPRKDITLTSEGTPARGQFFKRNNFADYIIPTGEIGRGLHETEYVMYTKEVEADAVAGSEVLADVTLSAFDRSYLHYCSHRQAPSFGKKGGIAVVKSGRLIYFAHPIFTQYKQFSPIWCRKLVINAIEMLLDPVLKHDGPSTMLTTLNEQVAQNRYVMHTLHYIPEKRSDYMSIIEETIPLYNINFSLKLEHPVKSVKLVPQMEEVAFRDIDGRTEFCMKKLDGHQMVELQY